MGRDSGAALVTGAAQGIGAVVARELHRSGAPVALLDRTDAVVATAADLQRDAARGAGAVLPALPALPVVADVSDAAAVDDAVALAERELGPIGLLVNVAGVLRAGPFLEEPDEHWNECVGTNATGVWNACRSAGRRMYARGDGCIVTVASNSAGMPRTGMAAYAASKAAAVALTRCVGLELAPHVRANVVCPGSTDTAMQRALWPDPDDDAGAGPVIEGFPERYWPGIPLRRIADPVDVANAVLFLASDSARQITMQTLTVDGGATLGA